MSWWSWLWAWESPAEALERRIEADPAALGELVSDRDAAGWAAGEPGLALDATVRPVALEGVQLVDVSVQRTDRDDPPTRRPSTSTSTRRATC